MAWGAITTTDAKTLTGTMQTLQISSVDVETELNPGERAHVQIEFNPQATPSEHCEWQILATPDGTNYDQTPFYVGTIDKDLADPNLVSVLVEGVWGFIVQARVVDPNGAAGGTDTTSTALARIRKDGVSL
jgi:hypothetical protein